MDVFLEVLAGAPESPAPMTRMVGGREDWRTFRVDRVQQVSAGGAQFVPRKFPGDIAAYVSRSIMHTAYNYRMKLRLKGAHEVLSKQLPSWCGQLEKLDDEHCSLSVGADSIETLITLVVMTRMEFEVLDSHELLPELRQVTDRLRRAFG